MKNDREYWKKNHKNHCNTCRTVRTELQIRCVLKRKKKIRPITTQTPILRRCDEDRRASQSAQFPQSRLGLDLWTTE